MRHFNVLLPVIKTKPLPPNRSPLQTIHPLYGTGTAHCVGHKVLHTPNLNYGTLHVIRDSSKNFLRTLKTITHNVKSEKISER